MNKFAVIYDEIFLKHNAGDRVESPDRLAHAVEVLKRSSLNEKIDWFKPVPVTEEELELVHTPEMIDYLDETVESGGGWLDPNTHVSTGSYEAATAGAGSGKIALGLVYSTGYKRVFVLTRPPGHHATSSRSMGSCLFNNSALCVKLALEYGFAKKVVVIDWDVHHGNGTEEIFYKDSSVFTISVHQHSLFPGTGFAEDTGIDRGRGFNLNIPIPAGAGIPEYLRAFDEIIKPAVEEFGPDLFVVSAGFDGHKEDSASEHNLTARGYADLADRVRKMADNSPAEGKIIGFLEGGYNRDALAESIHSVIEDWMKE